MADHARSSDAAVQAQLDRLWALSPGADVLGLSRITELLRRLGNPQDAMPPVFHVAGTNGKGSTCAFLRAALEAEGYTVHAYTSPHLVRFNERIRVAGRLIEDAALAPLLSRVLDVAADLNASFFEVTTAAAFLAFAETPADAAVIEVGLGGRLDATNVFANPAACGIAQLGIDHQAFLGSDPVGIGREKAGIARAGRPLVTLAYEPDVAEGVARIAANAGAPMLVQDRDWSATWVDAQTVRFADGKGSIDLPKPALPGAFQANNLGLAAAMLRAQDRVPVSDRSIAMGSTAATWPARLQKLGDGPLTRLLPPGSAMWVDGGHNPAAAVEVAKALATILDGEKAHIILGMLANKDPVGLLTPFAPSAASLTAIPVADHECHPPEALAAIAENLGVPARAVGSLEEAISGLSGGSRVTIVSLGSLYVAGTVLGANGEIPN